MTLNINLSTAFLVYSYIVILSLVIGNLDDVFHEYIFMILVMSFILCLLQLFVYSNVYFLLSQYA